MGLQEDKDHIISGIYTAKEFLFFFIGIGTLIAVPFLGAGNAVATFQLVIIGMILTLEGFASVAEIGINFMIQRGIPWIENEKRKIARRRG